MAQRTMYDTRHMPLGKAYSGPNQRKQARRNRALERAKAARDSGLSVQERECARGYHGRCEHRAVLTN